jgi:hypothetical protein
MPDSDRRKTRWIWMLALLGLAVLVFFTLRQKILVNLQQAATTMEGSSPAGAPLNASGERAPVASPMDASSPVLQAPLSASSDSDNWYVTVTFKGVVRNEVSKAPVDGATVRITAFSSPSNVLERTTDAGGKFQVVAPPAYRYGIKVEAEGFRSYQDDSLVITRPYYDLEILLNPGLAMRGRVVDPAATGIADALVQLRRTDDRSPALMSTTTDAQGAFFFAEIPRFDRYNLSASHPGYDLQAMAAVSVPSESEVILRMTPVGPSGALGGNIIDTAGNPAGGAGISLFDPKDGRWMTSMLADSMGRYRFPRMREGLYVVQCTTDGQSGARAGQGAAEVTVSRDQESRYDCTVDAGLPIRGVVVNQKQEPVVQAQITCSPDEAQKGRIAAQDNAGNRGNPRGGMQRPRNLGFTMTDSEGRFQIPGLPDGQYQLSVSHRDYQSLVTRLRPSAQNQTLILDAGLTLRGTVRDARGAALGAFMLTFQSTSGRTDKSYAFTSTDGHFEVHGLARDTYQVGVQAPGHGRFSSTLDLQASAEVFLLLDSARGGRGPGTLTLIKTK